MKHEPDRMDGRIYRTPDAGRRRRPRPGLFRGILRGKHPQFAPTAGLCPAVVANIRLGATARVAPDSPHPEPKLGTPARRITVSESFVLQPTRTTFAPPQRRRPVTSSALVPPELLDPVAAYFKPRRVILFGSAARGEAGPDSDIDLLIIVDEDTPPENLTLKAGYESRQSHDTPTDIFPCREQTYRRGCQIAGTLPYAARTEGIVVYQRGRRSARRRSQAGRPALIARRQPGYHAGPCLPGGTSPIAETTAFDCRRTAEKLTKSPPSQASGESLERQAVCRMRVSR